MHVRRLAAAVVAVALSTTLGARAASAQLFTTGAGSFAGSADANAGLGQGIVVSTATNLTQIGFWLGTPTPVTGLTVKYLIWDGTSNSLVFSQTKTLGATAAGQTLTLSDAFSYALASGRTYFFGVVADQAFTVGANLIPATATSMNGLTFDTDAGSVNGNVVFSGFTAPTTSTSVDDRAGATLALYLNGTQGATAVVPEPGTVLLVGLGLAGVGAAARRRRQPA